MNDCRPNELLAGMCKRKIARYILYFVAIIFLIPLVAIAQSGGKYIVCGTAESCLSFNDFASAYATFDKRFPTYFDTASYGQGVWIGHWAVPLRGPSSIQYMYGYEPDEAVYGLQFATEQEDIDYLIEYDKEHSGYTPTDIQVMGSYLDAPNFASASIQRIDFVNINDRRRVEISHDNGVKLIYDIGKHGVITCPDGYYSDIPSWQHNLNYVCRTTYAPTISTKMVQVNSCPVNGQPCFPGTGDKARFEKDLDFPSGAFVRNYHSMQQTSVHGMARGWTHSYGQSLLFSGYEVSAIDEKGNIEPYVMTDNEGGSGYSVSTPGRVINKIGGEYRMVDTGDLIKTFDIDGKLIRIESISTPQKNATLAYNKSGRLESVTDAVGHQLLFKYSDDGEMGLLTEVDSSDGQSVTYDYDSAGNLSAAKIADYKRDYHYADAGQAPGLTPHHLTGISENGVSYAAFSYDAKGRPISSTLNSSNNSLADTTNIEYDDYYGHATVTRPSGERRLYDYDGPDVYIMSYGSKSYQYYYQLYQNYNWLTGYKDPNGNFTDYSYANSFSYPNVFTEASGTEQQKKTTIERDNSMQVVRSVVEGGADSSTRRLSTAKRDDTGRTLAYCNYDNGVSDDSYVCGSAVNAPSGVRQTTLQYCLGSDIDAGRCPLLGVVTSVDGPRTDLNDTTSYTYYSSDDSACATSPTTCTHRKGELWKVTNALGQVTEYLAYDGAGRLLSVKDTNGVVTDYTYHPRGWLTARKVRGSDDSTESDDRITRIDYWPTGLVKQITQPDGGFTAFTYDGAHRLTDIADNAGNTVHYTLDNAGNRLKEDTLDASGTLKRTLSRVYNQLGQLATQASAQGNPTDFGYDANGNITTITDALGHITQNHYDPLNRLASTLQDVGGIAAQTTFAYDALDHITQVTDPKGLNTTYAYNGLGDLTTLTSPDTGTTTYTYDSAGNRATQINARKLNTGYSYDALNRLSSAVYPDTRLNVSYTYDIAPSTCASGETYAIGRLSHMQDGSGGTDYCYDRFGNLVRKVQTTNGKVLVLRYAYTQSGKLSQLTYPDGAVVDYVRNARGQITEVGVTPSGGTRQVLLTKATYYPFGPVAGWSYGNGRPMQRVLDHDYRPQTITDTRRDGLAVGFGFDPGGNLSALTAPGNTAAVVSLDYDALGRLTAFKDGPTGTVIDGYTYDATGNRLSAKVNTITQTYAYPTNSHQLSSVGSTVRSYDATGNTTAIGGTAEQLVYGANGRLAQVKRNGVVVANYAYNGHGEQVRQVGKTNTYTLYDEAGHWLGDYDSNGAAVQQAIWLDDLPVGVVVKKSVNYIEPDHLGTPRAVIDSVRDMAIWRWDMKGEAFGNTPPNQDPDKDGTAFVFNLRFPGQRYDTLSGLNQNYFRDYDTSGGRYVQSDPIGLVGGLNTYAYVMGNPLMYTDAGGLEVQVWARPININGPLSFLNDSGVEHWWFKTDTAEAGMGPDNGDVPGQAAPDMPFSATQVVDHTGESEKPGSHQLPIRGLPVDEDCVNKKIKVGLKTGPFIPFAHDCHMFVNDVLEQCRIVDPAHN
ncbi:RHS repeat-associated core domain-containing protein [Xanthomonas albilineans]|uniref:RHS repeat-associated core domain-containing protein n=1 Tax=Xanthomonas albilineans TaxID=29447 RepID=UPI000A575DD5|nr:RHS repeat-associated core domain-containing protein [Xanthomonas albilineans]